MKIRKDILDLIFKNLNSNEEEIYKLIMNDNYLSPDASKKGFLFESICEILITTKCIGVNYDKIYSGQYPNIKPVVNFKNIFKKNIHSNEGGVSDIIIGENNCYISFSIKYNKKFLPSKSDISHIDTTFKKENCKIGFICKNKELFIKHGYTNKKSIHKKLHDKIIKDELLFDEKDIIKAIKVFIDRFKKYKNNIEGFYNLINKDYLNSSRKQLVLKLHQKLAFLNFIKNLKNNEYKHIIGHKPRSGKSILMLLICDYLLQNGYNKILIMTAVPDTITDFVEASNMYIDFKDIKYKIQKEDDFNSIEDDFRGIVFSSIQFFKKDSKIKIDLLKKLDFDVIFNDECHLGGSTLKTRKNIIEVNQDDILLDNINKNIKLNIFVSGTPDKAKIYYNIKSSCIYEWRIEDEAYMKEITNNKDIRNIMTTRHGSNFKDCLDDISVNKDYSNCPIQVLVKGLLPQNIINQITDYNTKNKTNYGYSVSSLFKLKQCGKKKYRKKFEICSTPEGIEIMKNFIDNIISNDKMKPTIMKQIEEIQDRYGSRKSSIENPLLNIFYLPPDNIDIVSETLKNFVEKYNLWSDYNIEYSNSIRDTGDIKRNYNDFIEDIMKTAKRDKKKGVNLFLGNKGTTGITYDDCDVTISLDNGHSLDNNKQKFARAGTSAHGKTVFINVDMNIQRTYLFLIDKIYKFRKITKKEDMTYEQIIYYLYKHNIFLYDPLHYNNNNFKVSEIKTYYKNEIQNMMKEIDDTLLLENIICNEDYLKDYILTDWKNLSINKINPLFEGEQKDCPKPSITRIEIDNDAEIDKNNTNENTEEEIEENLINQTFEMCQSFMFPLLSLLSRSYNINNFKNIFDDDICKNIILKICQEKKIDLNLNNYSKIKKIMSHIIDTNDDIINSIREIYRVATPSNIRSLIEKHFIPSKDEKNNNAEISTPVKLVDDMLSKIPSNYWTDIHYTFEPCCGKGNFVLGIFDMFYNGLEKKIHNKVERCKTIMTECLYYGDLTNLNVFITSEILKCHIEDKCGEKVDYEFNSNIGDTLSMNIEKKWDIKGFNAIIGNPPYNAHGTKATGNTLWQEFTKKTINEWLLSNGYLSFVHPPGWRKPNTKRGRFTKMFDLMTKQNQMLYLEIHGIKDGQKVFNCGTRYDWYLIEKKTQYKNTIIIDEDGKQNEINLSELSWLPNSNILEINNILAKNDGERCPIMYDRTAYGADKKDRVSPIQSQEFKYPCVHSTPKTGIRYMYSKVNDRGHFGVSKVIFGESGIYKPVIDMEGKYGMTHGAMAIKVDNLEEATFISKVIESDKFGKIIQSCIFSSFRIDWNIFKEFKKDFWKEFIDEENIIKNSPKNKVSKIKDDYTIIELKNLLKEKGIKGYSKLKKQELIDLLEK
jgi:hypothetical protein